MKLVVVSLLAAALMFAAEPWNKDPKRWTAQDAQRILTSSPWAQTAKAAFADDDAPEEAPLGPLPGPAQAGMTGPRGATDGRWDGGVGRMPRGSPPTLPVLIRWDSAGPVREAAAISGQSAPLDADTASKDYVIAVLGLVPGNSYRDAGRLDGRSSSDDRVDARDPEDLLEGLMATSRLIRRGRPAIAPENVKLDAASGAVRIFFSRRDPITAAEKEVVFRTRFGSVTVQKTFRLRDMSTGDRLQL
jgi:hypothetical protein